MQSDCIEFCHSCKACQAETAKFLQHQTLTPIAKIVGPLCGWAIDLIVGMPAGSQGQTICIVAVDVFGKLIVPGALHDRMSATVAAWMYDRILTEFGQPNFIRTDNGPEFKDTFAALLSSYHITHTGGIPYYLQAQGQVEVYNKVIESALRRLLALFPSMYWDEFVT